MMKRWASTLEDAVTAGSGVLRCAGSRPEGSDSASGGPPSSPPRGGESDDDGDGGKNL